MVPARKITLFLIKIFDAHIKFKRKLAIKNSSNDTSGLLSHNRSNTNKHEWLINADVVNNNNNIEDEV